MAINAIDDPDGTPTAHLDLGEFPLISQLQSLLFLDETLTEFAESLESLLDRLQVMLETGAHHLPPMTDDDPPVPDRAGAITHPPGYGVNQCRPVLFTT